MSRWSGGDLGRSRNTVQLGPFELHAALLLCLLGLLAIALIWQGQWLGLLACGLSTLLISQRPNQADPQPDHQPAQQRGIQTTSKPEASATSDCDKACALDPAASSETPPPEPTGAALMAAAVVPAWTRQLEAIQSCIQNGTVDLLGSFSSVMGLQDQLTAEIQSQSSQGSDPESDQRWASLKQIGVEIQLQCENALHGLQFGDRVSQMVDVLHRDTERFGQQVPHMSQAQAADAQAWLAALEATYTTDEQRLFHHGQAYTPQQSNVEYF